MMAGLTFKTRQRMAKKHRDTFDEFMRWSHQMATEIISDISDETGLSRQSVTTEMICSAVLRMSEARRANIMWGAPPVPFVWDTDTPIDKVRPILAALWPPDQDFAPIMLSTAASLQRQAEVLQKEATRLEMVAWLMMDEHA